jgi:hypothetical protein
VTDEQRSEAGCIGGQNGAVISGQALSPAFGYRIDANGRSIVLSGDTRYSETLIRNAQGVDVLVHEVVFGQLLASLAEYDLSATRNHLTLVDENGQRSRLHVLCACRTLPFPIHQQRNRRRL